MDCAFQKSDTSESAIIGGPLYGAENKVKAPLSDGLQELRMQITDIASRVSAIRDVIFGGIPECDDGQACRSPGLAGDIEELNTAARYILADLRQMEAL